MMFRVTGYMKSFRVYLLIEKTAHLVNPRLEVRKTEALYKGD
jgi:hypothetical protein